MKEFEKILFPVDLSEVSSKIAPWVLHVAKKFDAKIHLLFVARKFEHFIEVYVTPDSIENFEGEIISGAKKKMEEFAETHFKGYAACEHRVVLGDAAEEIIKYIQSEMMDLVIMGTHGRKGLEGVLFGSVADRVVKMSTAPVLSINPYRVPGF